VSFDPPRPGEDRLAWAQRLATAWVGINEEQDTRALIEMLAHRHGFRLSNDEFAAGYCTLCRQDQPCDGAIEAALFSKLLWLLGAISKR
jgi:hypothetical protein